MGFDSNGQFQVAVNDDPTAVRTAGVTTSGPSGRPDPNRDP